MDEIAREIEQCIPRLRRYARALTGNPMRADDLVQDTLERAWSRLHLWRRGSDLRAWMFTIMHNLFVNSIRRSHPDQFPLEDEALDVPMQAIEDRGLELRDLQKALERLPDEQREVLLLVVLEEMHYEQVAEVLDVPIGTVMSRLSRARERLRVALSGNSPMLRRVK